MFAKPLPALHCLLVMLLCLGALQARTAEYQLQTVAEGLHHPWSVAQLPTGGFLLTERRGRLLHLRADGGRALEVAGVPPVYVAGQGGLFDVLLHPRYPDQPWIYLSFAEGNAADNGTTVIRARLQGQRLEDVTPILRVRDRKDTPQHYGGRMLFLPDETLLVTTGDGFDYREAAQDPGSELGKILRIRDDGSVPGDNPFVNSSRPRVYSYGHRNPQGLALDQDNGRVYEHEHGPRGGDELNLLRAGSNYGWPAISYGLDYSGTYVSPYSALSGMEQPLYHWTPSIAPSGMAWYGGEQFPAWRGDLFIGALVDRDVRRIDLEDGKVRGEESLFSELKARIRDVHAGRDGYLYLLTDSEQGRLIRVAPAAVPAATAAPP
jgi:glucose/arabinose dehydrogenase